jgi:hypothetical protein
MMIRPSESPFDRLGAAQGQERPRVRAVALIQGATIFAQTHQALGEWRRWREVLEASGIEDGFDLGALSYPDALSLLTTTPLQDGSGDAELDLTATLGVWFALIAIEGALVGDGGLVVEDVGFGAYTIALRAPGDAVAGTPQAITDADFAGADGSLQAVRLELVSEAGRARVVLEIDRDAWLVLWMARELTVRFAATPARTALLAPVEVAR